MYKEQAIKILHPIQTKGLLSNYHLYMKICICLQLITYFFIIFPYCFTQSYFRIMKISIMSSETTLLIEMSAVRNCYCEMK